jgi:arabinogalactan oligomer/maltooligosaccharide transport system permease protein
LNVLGFFSGTVLYATAILIAAVFFFGVVIWGIVDAAAIPRDDWDGAGQSKALWMLLLIGAIVIPPLIIATIVYFFFIRPKLNPMPQPVLGTVTKYVLLVILNGLVLAAIPRFIDKSEWGGLFFALGALVIIDVVYLSRRFVPAKYLVPGTLFLALFAVYPVLYTFYISFTNYGTGNNLGKADAIAQIERNSIQPPSANAPRYKLQVIEKGGTLTFLLTDDKGQVFLGTNAGLTPADPAQVKKTDDIVTGYDDYTTLTLRQKQDQRDAIGAVAIPTATGFIKNEGFSDAREVIQTLKYDSKTNTFTDVTNGKVYTDKSGTYTAADGTTLTPGYRSTIGIDNYTRINDSRIRGPFLRVFVWTFVFAIGSVAFSFALGLLLAMVFNNQRMKGKRVYRSLLIIPYALPSFMTALVWKGMMNQQFGVLNRYLHTDIPWLNDGTWAKVSLLLVNLWLGFPYMFLVATGALQGIPPDLNEAARVDGATGLKAFTRVTFPLLMVALSPLLIASFAYNFNNFNIVYLLTEGRPAISGSTAGQTDILVTYTYKLAFGGRSDYGFAAAISIVIFVLVAGISAIGFRFTRTFEEVK